MKNFFKRQKAINKMALSRYLSIITWNVNEPNFGLKLKIQKTKIMASGPVTSWEIDVETASDFMFLGSKITADGDCSHEIKRCLLLGRKLDQPRQHIQKQRHYFAD